MTSPTVRCRFTPSPKPAPGRSVKEARAHAHQPPGPSRAARLLALAHRIARQIDDGALRDYAAAARALGVTRARVTQVMNLLLLAPEIQEAILTGELRFGERGLRAVVRVTDWERQRTYQSNSGSSQHPVVSPFAATGVSDLPPCLPSGADIDPRLLRLIRAWPRVPENVRQALALLV